METDNNIEKDIERVLAAAKNVKPVDAPLLFTEKTMQRIGAERQASRVSTYALLKVAAVLLLIGLNVYTISRVLETPLQQPEQVKVSMDDLVKDYQVTDVSNDWLNNKIQQNEQP
ncbi:MAG TPA: hypothetical protein VK783_11750 [Bacteroidia bacterium]|jgi:hypothetical protein|nr:hypothetical protein [Bacteroidia bacterium]